MNQLTRIRDKLKVRDGTLGPILSKDDVRTFERLHEVELPECYREFLLTVGDGGVGPPFYGLTRLGEVAADMHPDQQTNWLHLPKIKKPFPFTRHWIWESGETSIEGIFNEIENGSIFLGNDGCGMYWHLIITGPDRGIPWMICSEGIQPVCPKRNFLEWYEDWLDGKDSFYGFSEHLA